MGEAAVFLHHRHTETHIAKALPHAALIAGSALALAQRIGFGGFFGGVGGGGVDDFGVVFIHGNGAPHTGLGRRIGFIGCATGSSRTISGLRPVLRLELFAVFFTAVFFIGIAKSGIAHREDGAVWLGHHNAVFVAVVMAVVLVILHIAGLANIGLTDFIELDAPGIEVAHFIIFHAVAAHDIGHAMGAFGNKIADAFAAPAQGVGRADGGGAAGQQ